MNLLGQNDPHTSGVVRYTWGAVALTDEWTRRESNPGPPVLPFSSYELAPISRGARDILRSVPTLGATTPLHQSFVRVPVKDRLELRWRAVAPLPVGATLEASRGSLYATLPCTGLDSLGTSNRDRCATYAARAMRTADTGRANDLTTVNSAHPWGFAVRFCAVKSTRPLARRFRSIPTSKPVGPKQHDSRSLLTELSPHFPLTGAFKCTPIFTYDIVVLGSTLTVQLP